MKRFIAVLAIVLIPALCFGAEAGWTVINTDNVPITGFSLEMERADNPGVVIGRWNTTLTTQQIPDSKFLPGTYNFRVLAYNGSPTPSAWATATYLVEGTAYQPGPAITPPDVSSVDPPPTPDGFVLQSAVWTLTYVPGP